MTTFYKNYVSLCAKIGKSPSAVAEELGFSRTSPNGWKKGKIPRDASLSRIASYFNISVEELQFESENKPAPSNGNELDIEKIINSMTREQLVDFIMAASTRLREIE